MYPANQLQNLDEAVCISHSSKKKKFKICIQLYFFQIWINSRANWTLFNLYKRGKSVLKSVELCLKTDLVLYPAC